MFYLHRNGRRKSKVENDSERHVIRTSLDRLYESYNRSSSKKLRYETSRSLKHEASRSHTIFVTRSAVGWVFICPRTPRKLFICFPSSVLLCYTRPAPYRPDGGSNYKRVSLNMNYFTGNDKLMRFRDFKIIILFCGLV